MRPKLADTPRVVRRETSFDGDVIASGVTAFALNHAGRALAIAQKDPKSSQTRVCLRDVSAETSRVCLDHEEVGRTEVAAIAFDPSGRRVVVLRRGDRTANVRAYDARTGKQIGSIPNESITNEEPSAEVAWGNQGLLLQTAAWDPISGTKHRDLLEPRSGRSWSYFSANGRWAAVEGELGRAREEALPGGGHQWIVAERGVSLVDVTTRRVAELPARGAREVAVSDRGRVVVARPTALDVYDGQKLSRSLETVHFQSFALSPDGELAVVLEEGTTSLHLYSVERGAVVRVIQTAGPLREMAIASTRQALYAMRDDALVRFALGGK